MSDKSDVFRGVHSNSDVDTDFNVILMKKS